jgi:MFS family permease
MRSRRVTGLPARAWLGILLLQSLLMQSIAFLIRPASSYEAIAIGLPGAALGAVGATFALVPLLLAVPLGRHVEQIGETRLHAVGATCAIGASGVLLVAPPSLTTIVAANALLGAGHLVCVVSQQTLVANAFTHERLDTAFGYYTFAASLGQAIGPLLIAALGGSSVAPRTDSIFWCSFGLSTCLLAATPLLKRDRPNADQPRAPRDAPSTRALLAVPGLPRAVATSAVILAAVDLTVVYLPALGVQRGLSSGVVGTILAVRGLASMTSRLFLGRLSAALGRTRLMTTSIALSAACLALVVVPMPIWLLTVLVAVLGLGLGVGQPLTLSWVTQQAPAGQRGQALSLRLAGNRFGQLVLPSVLGMAATGTGASGALIAISMVLGGTLPLLRGVNLD